MAVKGRVIIGGVQHKIGVHGLVFMEIDGDWVRSTKPAVEVKALLGWPVKKNSKKRARQHE